VTLAIAVIAAYHAFALIRKVLGRLRSAAATAEPIGPAKACSPK
jgi:hypothetical protein